MNATTKDFEALFVRLRDAMEPFGVDLVVTRDAPGDYYVESGWIRDDGYHGFFGAVRTNKRYVSYHLMPVYAWPDLLDPVSPWLRRRMQGKSCFNFTAVEDDQLTELADLTRRGYERLRDSGSEIHPHPRLVPPRPLTRQDRFRAGSVLNPFYSAAHDRHRAGRGGVPGRTVGS